MRLVGTRVADSGEDRDLALRVELGEPCERRVPTEPVVLGERQPGRRGQREARSESAVERVAAREEERERVRAAVEEDRDKHLLRAGSGGRGDPLLERAREERGAAVDRQREPGATGQEAPAIEARAGGERHPGLDRGQTLAGFGGRTPHQVGAGEVGAAPGHQCFVQ